MFCSRFRKVSLVWDCGTRILRPARSKRAFRNLGKATARFLPLALLALNDENPPLTTIGQNNALCRHRVPMSQPTSSEFQGCTRSSGPSALADWQTSRSRSEPGALVRHGIVLPTQPPRRKFSKAKRAHHMKKRTGFHSTKPDPAHPPFLCYTAIQQILPF